MTQTRTIRPARPGDAPKIFALISELARYEKLEHEVTGSAEALDRHLFGPHPLCEALICEGPREMGVLGFALVFPTYSTFKTGPCLHLEDLFVRPGARGHGHGKALFCAVHALAAQRNMARVTWNVLDWNTPAIEFYERLGASILPDWRVARVEGPAISELGRQGLA